MLKITLFLSVLALWGLLGVNSATPSSSPPAQDCSSVVLSMTDCLSFVTNGSTVKKPEGGCCSGLKSVLKTAPECLCETFKNSGQLGIALDMAKAMTLPSACGVKAPPFSNCGLSVAPGASPAHSPKSSKTPSPTSMAPASTIPTAVSPSPVAEGPGFSSDGSIAPASGPGSSSQQKSASSALTISFVMVVSMVVLSSSHF